MSNNRVYSEEELCEYTILQKIEALQKELDTLKASVDDTYTKEESDNKYPTKEDSASKTELESLTSVTPTDVGIKDNKLGLLHDTKWLTNQNAINLSGFEYDYATNTLKASESYAVFEITAEQAQNITNGFLITDEQNQFILNNNLVGCILKIQGTDVGYPVAFTRIVQDDETVAFFSLGIFFALVYQASDIDEETNKHKLSYIVNLNDFYGYVTTNGDVQEININGAFYYTYFDSINGESIVHSHQGKDWHLTEDKTISLFGNHSILVPEDSSDTNIDLYRHNIEIAVGAQYNMNWLYLEYISSSNLAVDSVTDLNTLLGITNRTIPVTGANANGEPILAISWKGTFANSKFIYINLGVAVKETAFADVATTTTITDVVTTI